MSEFDISTFLFDNEEWIIKNTFFGNANFIYDEDRINYNYDYNVDVRSNFIDIKVIIEKYHKPDGTKKIRLIGRGMKMEFNYDHDNIMNFVQNLKNKIVEW